jgi:uncharacterized membrane protein
MEEFFLALVPITLILSVAGVLIFRPLTKRLGNVMEANALARQQVVDDKLHHEHVKTLLETQNLKILQLEQRLQFTESLLETRAAQQLTPRPAHKELA